MLFSKKSAYEKEMAALLKKERRFLKSRSEKKESFINRTLLQKPLPLFLKKALSISKKLTAKKALKSTIWKTNISTAYVIPEKA